MDPYKITNPYGSFCECTVLDVDTGFKC